ncbi:hypothetical protein [Pseudonocardia spinosispora]|uniref:hypothetical protein n=1 Tax=Pseudonocardia spinosispora TaxID=103441 RepID=UPI0012EC2AB6|nr:hypothetical protein [Pseudonocardia spinosispora]
MIKKPADHSLEETARILRQWPDVCRALIEIHVPGPDGRCLGCFSQVHGAPKWRCALRLVADLAIAPGVVK